MQFAVIRAITYLSSWALSKFLCNSADRRNMRFNIVSDLLPTSHLFSDHVVHQYINILLQHAVMITH